MKQYIDKNQREVLKNTLFQIQQRVQIKAGKNVTYAQLADMAGVSARSIAGWMGGTVVPPGMSAVMQLLSELSEEDILNVINFWKSNTRSQSEVK